MNRAQLDEQMNQVIERANRRSMEEFHKQQMALFKQEQAQKKQKDIEVSVPEMPRQTTETLT